MFKWLQKILISLAVLPMLGHGIIPHRHTDDTVAIAHHDKDHDGGHDMNSQDDQNPFSYKYLDHNYTTPAGVTCFLSIAVSIFILPINEFCLTSVENIRGWQFIIKNEHPPPLPWCHTVALRGPPTFC